MPPCKFFAAGSCRYGTSCKNAHIFAPPECLVPTIQGTRPKQPVNLERYFQSPAAETAVSSKTPCWFFLQGRCSYGASCKNAHDIPAPGGGQSQRTQRISPRIIYDPDVLRLTEQVGELHVSGPGTSPLFQANRVRRPEQSQTGTICTFFARGSCRNGDSCRYEHQILSPGGAMEEGSHRHMQEPILDRHSSLQTLDEYTRDINGALVSFGAGAEVARVKLVSDFSSIEIIGLPANANANTVSKILQDLYHPVDDFHVVFKTSAEGASIAEARAEDPHFASEVVFKWENSGPRQRDFLIKDTSHTAGNEATKKRIQLSTVICTWYQSSRLAWLVYRDQAIAMRVIDHIKKIKILGRTPDAVMQQVDPTDGSVSSCTVCLRDLHGQTTLRDIRHKLFSSFTPENVTLGKPTYELSDNEAAKQIQELFCSHGASSDSFQYRIVPGSSKMKATATFLEESKAAEAARQSGIKIPELGNTKLFINHIVSIKYNISSSIVTALKEDIDKLTEDFARGGYVQLRIYPQADLSKSYTTIRLFWENLKDVSGAKIRLEKLLAGVGVRKGGELLWDPYFSTFAALDDLDKLGARHASYIFRDSRKSQLVIYGGTVYACKKIQQALIDKVEEMHQSEHILLLTPQLYRLAVQGGMRRLKAKFGDAVKLNVNLNSSTITITGSTNDFTQAKTILRDTTFVSSPLNPAHTAETCVICWTAAVEPVSSSCNHTYCKECFANQATSATGNEIPLRCFGAEGTCQQVFTFDELKRLLPSLAFESLLHTSFDCHVRTRPNDFQYCPTPDCPQIYRPETNYEFFCTTCLTPICTKCKVISHDGMTCEEWQEIGTEEGRLFRQYKEEHDVRDCPNCGVEIEKNEGCNHMECTECGSHICWFCMEVFEESGECYEHMKNAHGTMYDYDDDDDY